MMASGLPTYTVPSAGGELQAAPPFGVGAAASGGGPSGGFSTQTAAQGSPPPSWYPDYEPATSAVPQQRNEGTIYGVGTFSAIDMTMPVSTNPLENSGSLTGHILARGWRDEVVDRRRNNLKVGIAMLVVLGLLITVSMVFLLTTGSALSNMIKGIFH